MGVIFMINKFVIIAICAIIILTIILIIVFVKSKSKNILSIEHSSKIIDSLGGVDNINSFEKKVSRINVYVEDIKLVDSEAIKEISGCGILIVNDKVQIILKENANGFETVLVDLEMSDQNKKVK